MSILHAKVVVSLFFLAAGIVTFLSMLALMGKAERKASPKTLRATHLAAGVLFTVLLAVQAYLGAKYVAGVGDQLSLRAVFHAVLALGLVAVLVVKILIVQYYRKLMTYVPALGMIVFVLALVVFLTSAGYDFVREAGAKVRAGDATDTTQLAAQTGEKVAEEQPADTKGDTQGNVEGGRVLFEGKCSFCHFADSEESSLGPGLKSILTKAKLPSSGKPATASNILEQLKAPVGTMPAFTTLTNQELGDLLAFMRTL
ncbi:MAG: cytochrome c [Candidatus Eisenbacteria bacterium]